MRLFLLISVLCLPSFGSQWRVSWDRNVPGIGVSYRVVKLVDGLWSPLGETAADSMVLDLTPGDQISIIAFNELGEADPAPGIIIPEQTPPPPDYPTAPKMVRVHVYQISCPYDCDPKARREIATLYVEKKQADFFQLGIETP